MAILMGFNAFGTRLQSLWIMLFLPEKFFLVECETECRTKSFFRQLRFSLFSSARYFDICLRRFLSKTFTTDPWVVVLKRYTL